MKHNSQKVYRIDASEQQHSWLGEQKLARAVIINGLREAAHGHHPAHKAEALGWLLSDSIDPCSFLWWLGFLTDDPEGLADFIRRKVDLTTIKSRVVVDASTEIRTISEEHRAKIADRMRETLDARRRRREEDRVAELRRLMALRKSSTT